MQAGPAYPRDPTFKPRSDRISFYRDVIPLVSTVYFKCGKMQRSLLEEEFLSRPHSVPDWAKWADCTTKFLNAEIKDGRLRAYRINKPIHPHHAGRFHGMA